jgi:hypothetical protein
MTTDERDRLRAFSLRVWGYKQGEMVSLMIHLAAGWACTGPWPAGGR